MASSHLLYLLIKQGAAHRDLQAVSRAVRRGHALLSLQLSQWWWRCWALVDLEGTLIRVVIVLAKVELEVSVRVRRSPPVGLVAERLRTHPVALVIRGVGLLDRDQNSSDRERREEWARVGDRRWGGYWQRWW